METSLVATPESAQAVDPEVEAMLKAGVHLGHARSKRNAGMVPFIWGVRNGIDIIDLTKTTEKLSEALAFLTASARQGRLLLFVGTRPAARDLVAKLAADLGHPYVNVHWIGGTLTNFSVISKRIQMLIAIEAEAASGGFEHLPKKERIRKTAELDRLRENFDGLRRLERLPDAIVIVDLSEDDLALREARRMKIPVVALTDTNTDPRSVSYPIPSNDDARPAITYMLEQMAEAIRQGQREARQASVAPEGEGGGAPEAAAEL